MSEDKMLMCLIAFVIGWLLCRAMGNGFSVGGVDSSPYTCSQGFKKDCEGIPDSRDCDEYYYIDHQGAVGQDRHLPCTEDDNPFSDEKCDKAWIAGDPCPDNPKKKPQPSCLAQNRNNKDRILARIKDGSSTIPALNCSQVKLQRYDKPTDTCDNYYVKDEIMGSTTYYTCSGDALPGSKDVCKNDIPCKLPYTYCPPSNICPDGLTKCVSTDANSVCPGFPKRPSVDCTVGQRDCPPRPGTKINTYCPEDGKCKIWPLYPP